MIVVLGASGKTGRVVAERVKQVERVRSVTRQAGRLDPESGVEIAIADLADEAALSSALRGARALFALLPDDLTAENFHAERRKMAENIARAVRREQVPRVVLLSSTTAGLGERAGNGFGADLAYFERLLSDTNAVLTVLRASYFQDNVLAAVPAAEGDGVYINLMPSRETQWATIASADIGAFAAAALLAPPRQRKEVVDLVGPSYSPNDIAGRLGDALGRSLSIVDVPAAHQEGMLQQWMSRDAARAMAETLACLVSGRVVLSGDRVERGPITLEETLASALSGRARPRQAVHP